MNLWKKYYKFLFTVLVCSVLFGAESFAGVTFVPSGGGKLVRAKFNNPCKGYTLIKPKCDGQPCRSGWECDSCQNAGLVRWKCTEVGVVSGYTVGLTSCPEGQTYHSKYSGNRITGRCE